MSQNAHEKPRTLENLTSRVVAWASGPWALEITLLFLGVWFWAGPFLAFSEEWRAILNVVSETITLAMVFLLARTQAKDTLAMQIKLNEIVAAMHGADNQLINIESRGESAIIEMRKRYEFLAEKILNEEFMSTESISSQDAAGGEGV
jgi:low affinity Fe/Cu permease